MLNKILLFVILFPTYIWSEINVSEFSFTGKDISSFNLKPSFTNIDINFRGSKKFETYIDKIKLEFEDIKTDIYKTDEPGFMYKGKVGTLAATLFVGEKAYRNYLVKKYLTKNYLDVISAYEDYKDNIKDKKLSEEVLFIYTLSLFETGNHKKSIDNLKYLSANCVFYNTYALDKLFDYWFIRNNYKDILTYAEQIEEFTPFSLFLYLTVLKKNGNYLDIIKIINQREAFLQEYDIFYDFLIIATYYVGAYNKAISYSDRASPQTISFIIDSYLNQADIKNAEKLIQNLKDSIVNNYFKARIAIIQNNIEKLDTYMKQITKDQDKLNLLFLYVQKNFPDVDILFMESINFNDITNRDYIYFYIALHFLNIDDYLTSISYLQRIGFKDYILSESYFYLGVTYRKLDKKRSIYYFTKYLNGTSNADKREQAKYMLGQLYFDADSIDDAMIVISDCENNMCTKLRSTIYIKKKDFNKALNEVAKLTDEKGAYLKAVIYFNLKKYNSVLKQLNKIKEKNKDIYFLTMLTNFKLNKIDEAYLLYEKYKSYKDFETEAVKYMFLANKFDEVIKMTSNISKDDNELILLRAKSLSSLQKFKEAEKLYKNLIGEKSYLFDAIYGLSTIYNTYTKNNNDKNNSIDKIFNILKDYEFDKKDMLVLQLARQSLDKGDTENSIMLVNYFFEKYSSSIHIKDAYIVRAKIYKSIGEYKGCVNDINSILKRDENDSETLYLKSECLVHINKPEAINILINLSENRNRFAAISNQKLIKLSDNPKVILKSAEYFEQLDNDTYLTGMIKYLDLIDHNKLSEHTDIIEMLITSDNNNAAGLYFKAEILFNDGKFKEAKQNYMKSYYLDEKSIFAKRSLENTLNIYKKEGNISSANKIETILKKLK